jgi:PhzF family phenazine biosynthesis protein
MKLPIYQVDAFADAVFTGNPAAVVPLETWLSEAHMQSVAAENNLSATAFFAPNADGSFDLRRFTPEIEIPLCGHATIASAAVLCEKLGYSGDEIFFPSKIGAL